MESNIGHEGLLAWRQWFILLRAACHLLESVHYSAFPQIVYKQSLVAFLQSKFNQLCWISLLKPLGWTFVATEMWMQDQGMHCLVQD